MTRDGIQEIEEAFHIIKKAVGDINLIRISSEHVPYRPGRIIDAFVNSKRDGEV